ncbi:MAG: substrate-binding domain-containing protein [Planctomycetes bacterium]|nr:substrate-binding domain-containing protein [Planctomycetota bacterium]
MSPLPAAHATLVRAARHALPTMLLLGGASALLLATDRSRATRTMPAVAVLQQVSTTLLDDAVRGMIDGLAERGYVDGKTVTIRRYNAEGDLGQANAIAREIAGGAFDLALTSSTPSLQALATANARGRVLHVFSAVADPFSAGVGFDRSDPMVHPRHLVGYGSLAPVDATFRIARDVNPRLARVGVAHNPAEANSRRFMELARASCRARGIELVEAAVENSSGVVEAIQATLSRGVEAVFIPGDTTVSAVAESVVAAAAKAGVPVFTVVPGKPDRGTLFDVGFDFHEVGLLAGRLAGDLLDGVDPATVAIGETARERPPRLSINLAAPGYDRTRWRVPEALLGQARVVIDETGRRDQPSAVLAGPFTEAEAAAR